MFKQKKPIKINSANFYSNPERIHKFKVTQNNPQNINPATNLSFPQYDIGIDSTYFKCTLYNTNPE